MSKDQIKQILSMGYRPHKLGITNKIWLKPFGNAIFKIEEKKHETVLYMIFVTHQGDYAVWGRVNLASDVFDVSHIKEFENNQLSHPAMFEFSKFDFISAKEIIENGLM